MAMGYPLWLYAHRVIRERVTQMIGWLLCKIGWHKWHGEWGWPDIPGRKGRQGWPYITYTCKRCHYVIYEIDWRYP